MSIDQELDTYRREARSWDADRIAQAHRSTCIAWWTAGGAGLCALMSAAALLVLMPLKRVDPFVVRVDNTTGIVDIVPLFAGHIENAAAITRYLLTHYVSVCERFNYATAESDYQECGAFHSVQRNQLWSAAWSLNNPASPLNVYKDGTTVRVRVAAVSFFEHTSGVADLAQVRYVKLRRPLNGAAEQATHWIATVQYAYGEPSSDARTRSLNPLGFKIVEFRSEPEVISESANVKGSAP